MYVLVGVSALTGWLPAGCFGALCLAFPVVRPKLLHVVLLHDESCRSMSGWSYCSCGSQDMRAELRWLRPLQLA